MASCWRKLLLFNLPAIFTVNVDVGSPFGSFVLCFLNLLWNGGGFDTDPNCVVTMVSFDTLQSQTSSTTMEKAANVVLDIDSLAQSSDKCSGSPKMTKALSRKGSCRIERRSSEEVELDEASKKVVVKVTTSQTELLKQGSISNKPLLPVTATTNCSTLSDGCDARNKKFNRFSATHPRKILLIFASVSSMGTLILIYFTLAINRTSGA